MSTPDNPLVRVAELRRFWEMSTPAIRSATFGDAVLATAYTSKFDALFESEVALLLRRANSAQDVCWTVLAAVKRGNNPSGEK